jgi:hypothetical protein
MKALKMMLVVLLMQSVSFASYGCYESFLENYDILDSKSFILNDNNFENDFSQNPKGYVGEALVQVLNKVPDCSALVDEVIGQKSNAIQISCKELVKGKSYSMSCIAESKVGYFFLNVDMLNNVNLFFSRWD